MTHDPAAFDHIVATEIPVVGVMNDDDVKRCLQSLYDEFAALGIGQATFEITANHARLIVKHQDSVRVDLNAIDHALRAAGNYRVASDEH